MVKKFLQHVVPGVVRPLHILWNQIVGFFFLVLAVSALPSLYRSWREFNGEGQDFWRLGLTLVFTVVMTAYGIFSFLRARKISRPRP